MWIVCLTDNLYENASIIFSEKKKKKKSLSSAEVVIIALRVYKTTIL